MLYGWKGKILRVNLANKKITKQDLPEEWMKKFMGCRGIQTKIMWDEVGPEVDPFSPDNKLIFGTGPLEGTPLGMGRVSVQTKHPKRFIGEGGAAGYWAPELKFAGYDFVVIEKKSDEPVQTSQFMYLLMMTGLKFETLSICGGRTTGKQINY